MKYARRDCGRLVRHKNQKKREKPRKNQKKLEKHKKALSLFFVAKHKHRKIDYFNTLFYRQYLKNQQPKMSSTPAITALERTKLIHSGPDGVKFVQKLACRETILAMIEHREYRGAAPIVAYAINIGMKVQRALDYYGGESGNEPNAEAMSYYMDAVNILQKGGLAS